jgi:DNA invertase Pin-like site-specific DNA recombinase
VSTLDQDLLLQEEVLRAAGCQIVRRRAEVPGRGGASCNCCSAFCTRADTLVVTHFDRLARSVRDLQDIVHELKAKGVALKATEQPVDTGTAAGKAFLDMLGLFTEFETNLRHERQMEGIKAAKMRGVYKGRKPRIDAAEVRRLREGEGLGPAAIARRLGIGRASVYRLLGGDR